MNARIFSRFDMSSDFSPAMWAPVQTTLAPSSVVAVPMWIRYIELVPNALAIVLLVLFLLGQVRCERFVYTVLLANLFACAATITWYSANRAARMNR